MVDLIKQLEKFNNIGDCEFSHILYKTHVPSVAPRAYLTVIFKPVPAELRERRMQHLGFPHSLREFYKMYNGAHLFNGTINIFGLLPDTYFLDRANWFEKGLPLNVLEINQEYKADLKKRGLVCFADYGSDRSLVCMDKGSESIICFVGEDFENRRMAWPGLDEWLRTEIQRLSMYFDRSGKLILASDELLLPGTESRTSQ